MRLKRDKSKYGNPEAVQLRGGEYQEKGDYHINLNTAWPYLPVYLEKMAHALAFLAQHGSGKRIIDLGAGEGVLVRRGQQELGLDIIGLDINYESEFVLRGDILNLELPDASYDIVTCLDVVEHMHFHQQGPALAQMFRILKPGGRLLLSVPNLAHFASRFTFIFMGRLLRTSTIDRHIGDRPAGEFVQLLKATGFEIRRRRGLFPTFPLISALTYVVPSRVVWLHRLYNAVLGWPNWCFLNIFEAVKPVAPGEG
ncbi:MAG: class I SAM-dependent methyltransferase [Anaerolineae bacterium]|nr:MAG: class I SAM-dependent methyltransferase [Anaerolineae bacterium]